METARTTKDVDAIYRTLAPMMYRRAFSILRTESEARDLVQEIFLGLLEREEEFRGQSSLTTWLYSVTTHACLNRLRDSRNRARLLKENIDSKEGSETDRGPARSEVRQTLERLPEDLCAVAIHYFLDEMTHEEIAEVLGCSRRHVGNLLVRLEAHVQGSA
ncbi:MAG: sigma-70 family RNA polymerase sigma factor [Polyangiaceae bacterium]|nr:sigma-70 family RNA polymerase sigma factor [Polyangiaceae bacterium]